MADTKTVETFDDAKNVMQQALFPGSKKHDLSKLPEEQQGGRREVDDFQSDKPPVEKLDEAKSADDGKPAGEKPPADSKPAGDKPVVADGKPAVAQLVVDDKAVKPKRVKKSAQDKSAEALTEAANAIKDLVKNQKAAGDKKDEPKTPATDDIPEGRREDLAIFKELENLDPKYKGKAAEYIAFARKEGDYIKQWEAANTGKSFDPEADEHSEWYDANEPEVSDRDLRRAEIRLESRPLAEQLADERVKGLREKLEQFEVAEAVRGTQPKIEQNTAIAVGAALEAMSPDILKIVSEHGHDKLAKLHPAASAVIQELCPKIVGVVDAAVKIFETNGRAFNKANAFHQEVVDTALSLEKQLQDFDVEQLTKPDGTTFVTRQRWNGMADEERKGHWIVGAQEVNLALANKYAAQAKTDYEKRVSEAEKTSEARGWKKPAPAKTADKPVGEEVVAGDEKPASEAEDDVKPDSPSTGSSTVHRPGGDAVPKKTEKPLDFMANGMFGGVK